MTEYTRTLMEVFEEVGTHLSNAVGEPGGFKGTSRSDINNKIVDLPTLKKPDSLLKDLPAKDIAVLVGIITAAVAAAVVITVAVKDRKAKKQAKAAVEAKRLKPTVLEVIEIENVDQFRSQDLDEFEPSQSIELTPEQWNFAVAEMLKLEAFRTQAWELLTKAKILDSDEKTLEWQRTLEQSTPEELAQMIQNVLQQHPEVLSATNFSEMRRMLFKQGPDQGPEALGAPTR